MSSLIIMIWVALALGGCATRAELQELQAVVGDQAEKIRLHDQSLLTHNDTLQSMLTLHEYEMSYIKEQRAKGAN